MISSAEPLTLTVSENQKGMRLDVLLAQYSESIASPDAPALTRSRIQALIKQGVVTKNDVTLHDASYKTKEGDVITLLMLAAAPSNLEPYAFPLTILFEDEHLLIVNKPYGMTTHPGAGTGNDTLVHALLHHCKGSLSGIGGVERPGIVHRLDRDTSGLMVIAKHDIAHTRLSAMIQAREVTRIYHALVWGVPFPPKGVIDASLDRHRIHREQRCVVKSGGKSARTYYNVLESYQEGAIAKIMCRLETGRTHQIRVHMQHLKHPVVGDTLYGLRLPHTYWKFLDQKQQEAIQALKRQALHAAILAFTHPITQEALRFESPWENGEPQDVCHLIKLLKHSP